MTGMQSALPVHITSHVEIGGAALAFLRIGPEFRARNVSEPAIKTLLIICSSVAILTTVGIVFSLVFETLRFFESEGMFAEKNLFGH